jgi:hypothetical protein
MDWLEVLSLELLSSLAFSSVEDISVSAWLAVTEPDAVSKVGRLNSYFLPFLDIFSFANTHIRLIPEGDLEETLKNQCERIQLFCEVILGFLRQNQSDKMNQN